MIHLMVFVVLKMCRQRRCHVHHIYNLQQLFFSDIPHPQLSVCIWWDLLPTFPLWHSIHQGYKHFPLNKQEQKESGVQFVHQPELWESQVHHDRLWQTWHLQSGPFSDKWITIKSTIWMQLRTTLFTHTLSDTHTLGHTHTHKPFFLLLAVIFAMLASVIPVHALILQWPQTSYPWKTASLYYSHTLFLCVIMKERGKGSTCIRREKKLAHSCSCWTLVCFFNSSSSGLTWGEIGLTPVWVLEFYGQREQSVCSHCSTITV